MLGPKCAGGLSFPRNLFQSCKLKKNWKLKKKMQNVIYPSNLSIICTWDLLGFQHNYNLIKVEWCWISSIIVIPVHVQDLYNMLIMGEKIQPKKKKKIGEKVKKRKKKKREKNEERITTHLPIQNNWYNKKKSIGCCFVFWVNQIDLVG